MKKMTSIIFCSFLVSLSTAFAGTGDEVKNGGGIAEQYLAFALANMDKSIERCLANTNCAQKPGQRTVLARIRSHLNQEKGSELLQFTSETKKPGFFTIDGVVRLAVTGDVVGSPIYYNLDLLYKNGQVQINYGQAIQSLVHELGHHQNYEDHEMLEMIGSEVRQANEGVVSVTPFLPITNRFAFSALSSNLDSFEVNGSLLLLFQEKTVDLTSHFFKLQSNCLSRSSEGFNKATIQFFNLNWDYSVHTHQANVKKLNGVVALYCKNLDLNKSEKSIYRFSINVTSSPFGKAYDTFIASKLIEGPTPLPNIIY